MTETKPLAEKDILIVDYNQEIADLIAEVLRNDFGVNVVTVADDPASALELMQSDPPLDLVISEVVFPMKKESSKSPLEASARFACLDMNAGWRMAEEYLAWVREEGGRPTPIIFMTTEHRNAPAGLAGCSSCRIFDKTFARLADVEAVARELMATS